MKVILNLKESLQRLYHSDTQNTRLYKYGLEFVEQLESIKMLEGHDSIHIKKLMVIAHLHRFLIETLTCINEQKPGNDVRLINEFLNTFLYHAVLGLEYDFLSEGEGNQKEIQLLETILNQNLSLSQHEKEMLSFIFWSDTEREDIKKGFRDFKESLNAIAKDSEKEEARNKLNKSLRSLLLVSTKSAGHYCTELEIVIFNRVLIRFIVSKITNCLLYYIAHDE